MDDLVKTMKAQLYDRISSPLIFTFCTSWAVWNYRLILIVLSSAPPSDKFLQIDMLPLLHSSSAWLEPFVASWWAYWLLFSVIGPLTTTLLYLCVLPYFESLAFEVAQKKIVNLKKIKLRAEDDIPLGQEEGRRLRQSLRDAEERWDTTMEAQKELLSKEKAEVMAQLKSLEIQIEAERNEFQRASTENHHELSQLKSELDTAAADKKQLKTILAPIMFLEQGARDLFNKIAHDKVGLSMPNRNDSTSPEEKIFLQQLISIGLIERHGPIVTLSKLGESLHLERVLSPAG